MNHHSESDDVQATVAYMVDGRCYCPYCVTPMQLRDDNCRSITEYVAGEQEDGISCDSCGEEISSPHSKAHTFEVTVEVEGKARIGGAALAAVVEEIRSAMESVNYVESVRVMHVPDSYRRRTLTPEQTDEILGLLRLTLRYLEHPDIRAIRFAQPAPATRIRALLTALEVDPHETTHC